MRLLSLFKKINAKAGKSTVVLSRAQPAHAYHSIYDADGYGTLEIATGNKAMIPWCLTQRVDIFLSKIPSTICFDFMAEFHRDRLEFNFEESNDFLVAMERALENFNLDEAKSALSKLILTGMSGTIYRSPRYPADIVG